MACNRRKLTGFLVVEAMIGLDLLYMRGLHQQLIGKICQRS